MTLLIIGGCFIAGQLWTMVLFIPYYLLLLVWIGRAVYRSVTGARVEPDPYKDLDLKDK